MTLNAVRTQLRRSGRSWVVLLLALAVALLAGRFLAGQLSGGMPFSQKTTVHVAVDDAKAVLAGKNEVRWAGVVVGRVTEVKRRDGRPVITAQLGSEAPQLYRDARFRLRPQTALNDMFLDVVSRGTAKAGRLTSDDVVAAGRTQTPVDVAEVLNLFSTDVRDRLDGLLTELSVGLPDQGTQLRSAFAAVAPFVAAASNLGRTIGARDAETRRLVSQTRRVSAALADREDALRGLIDRASTTFTALGQRRTAIDRTLTQLPPTLEEAQSTFGELRTTLSTVRPALSELRPAARALPAGLRALDGIVTAAAPALRGTRPAVSALKPLAAQITPTSASLDAATRGLVPQLARIDQITAEVSRCKLPLQKFFANTMSTFKFGNRTNLTTSPRGVLTETGADVFGAPSNLVAAIGCADGKPAE